MYPLYMIASFNMVLKFRLPLVLLLADVARRVLAGRRVLPRAPHAAAALPRRAAREVSSPWLERRVIAFAHQGGSLRGTVLDAGRDRARARRGRDRDRTRRARDVGPPHRRLPRRDGRSHDEPPRRDLRPHAGRAARDGQRLLVDRRATTVTPGPRRRRSTVERGKAPANRDFGIVDARRGRRTTFPACC